MPDLIADFLRKGGCANLNGIDRLIAVTRDVAKIPWGEGRTIEEVLQTKRVGTCTGKHLVLQSCYENLGIPHRVVVCTFHWSEQKIAMPDDLRSILDEGEWKHGHNFLQIQIDGKWIDVDVTWDPVLQPFGFKAFPTDWNGRTPFIGLDAILERQDGADIGMKQQWLDALTTEQQEWRKRFLAGFFDWIRSLRTGQNP